MQEEGSREENGRKSWFGSGGGTESRWLGVSGYARFIAILIPLSVPSWPPQDWFLVGVFVGVLSEALLVLCIERVVWKVLGALLLVAAVVFGTGFFGVLRPLLPHG